MKNLLASLIALFALAEAGAAVAADLPMKAPASPPPSAYNWSGCYVGVNGGYGWNNGHTTYNDPNTVGDPINYLPGVGPFFAAPPPLTYIPTPTGTGGSGWLGGGGAGCDWQSQQWVFGVEGDIDGANISRSSTTSAFSGPNQFGLNPDTYTGIGSVGTANEQVSLRWLSTIRARVGFAIEDRVLLYATGGLAVGGVNSQGSVTVNSGTPFPVIWSGSNSTTKTGFVVGGGAEWAFSGHWTAKAEYLWYNLGSVSHPLTCVTDGGLACNLGGVYATLGSSNSSVFGSIVRVGVNYNFGAP